ncbi:MAG TPA: VCBS repeat-containing protein, partial [Xanthomonadaceae bacterium]|nr:VCBS repeat-containing protein [Xanthomonadaceae bacterium]
MARMRAACWALLSAAVFNGAASGAGFDFGPYATYADALSSWPDAVVIGDVTGDGRDDVVLATSFYFDPAKDYRLFIYPQTARGALGAPTVLPYDGTTGTVKLKLGDFNADGLQDIVVGHDQGVTLLLSDRGLKFSIRKVALTGISGLGVADINGDRKLDVVAQQPGSGATILLGNGDGLVPTGEPLPALADYQTLKVADVTGDGLLDLVASAWGNLSVFPATGYGQFGQARSVSYPGAGGYGAMAIARVAQGARNSILSVNPANRPDSRLLIHRQSASVDLSLVGSLESYDVPEAITGADLDRDGDTDILVAHGGWVALGRYMQGGEGLEPELLSAVPYASHYNPDGLATGDINGDGCTDAAIADYNHGLVVLRGSNCHEPWSMANRHDGDFDGDGRADILWHDAATGASVIWKSGDSATRITMTRVTNTDWTIAGAGDFDGDGKSDVLWHNV